MALTPEDVVNKRFQPTKFREGYDQDEVDDFLDEVVVELRRLTQENDELRQEAGGNAVPAQSDTPSASADALPTTAAPIEAAPVPETPAYVADIDDETASTSSLLQLARRLHEEHVREGIQRRDALIAEAEANAARIAAEAEVAQEARLVEAEAAQRARVTDIEAAQQSRIAEIEAEQESRIAEIEAEQQSRIAEVEAAEQAKIGALDSERHLLEQRIDELRTFEREYRENLKSYIEGQLRELDAADSIPSGEGSEDENEGSTSDRQDIAGG